MKKWLSTGFGTISLVLVGCTTTGQVDTAGAASGPAERPAYLIISVNEIHPERMDAYKKAVRPLVQRAGGSELVAIADPGAVQVLEGAWNFPGLLIIERFKSMQALKAHWNSPEYQEVKKLRDGNAVANFFVAIEGAPPPAKR